MLKPTRSKIPQNLLIFDAKMKNGHFRPAFDLDKKAWQYLTLITLGLTWGSSFILMKKGLVSFTPIEVASIRLSSAFIFLLPFVFNGLRSVPRAKIKYLIWAGLLGNGIPAFLFASAQTQIDSSLAAVLNSTAPIFTLIVGYFFFALVFDKASFLGILIGLISTAYLVWSSRGIQQPVTALYSVLPLLGAICYAFSINIIKKKLSDIPSLMVTGAALTFVGIPSVAVLIFNGTPEKIISTPTHTVSFLYVLVLGVCSTSMAVLIFNYLIKHTSVLFATSVTYLIPMFAMGWGFFSGENITFHYFLGLAGIFSGIYLANR
jgi:drug/metabolite transporter (DMT)-like permease